MGAALRQQETIQLSGPEGAAPSTSAPLSEEGLWCGSRLQSLLLTAAACTLLHTGFTPEAAASSQVSQDTRPTHNIVADIAEQKGGFMGFGAADGSNPFTVYGVAFKKYVIEVLDGEKIVSRKRGFTVDSCTAAISVAVEDAQGARFQGLPIGEKIRAVQSSTTCKRSEGPELKIACQSSCEASCNTTVDQYVQDTAKMTGIAVEEKERQRVTKSCIRDCRTECSKPGKFFDFVVPSRR